ncbi:hypothetical protein PPMP20_27985 [Paraburkholderia phymatum]|uniref:hypothetical protein n=1 Tax=Paraburkholderia phymatum TaxID=148447 RepID=UPI0012FE30DC|nr:hypothetical protein [Paraburkholderia phymatum]
MEQYLSKNRMNQALRTTAKTASGGLTRLNQRSYRRIVATMRQLTPSLAVTAKLEKTFKSKILISINPSIPLSGKHCCVRRKQAGNYP